MQVTEAVVTILVVAMVLGIPLAGLTLRFSLKPLVEAFIRLREVQLGASDAASLRARVAHLEHVLEAHGLLDAPVRPVARPLVAPEHLPRKERERV